MAKHIYLLSFFFLLFFQNTNAQTGCPGCTVNLPPLPEDTIFLGSAPDGTAGQFYDENISFRMPKTTDPINATDPSTPAGLNISSIEIVSLLNVPPGLNWEANQTTFNPSDETDGCVKFCGTPLIPGFYEVEVFVTAEVAVVSENTSFVFPIYIAPATSSNDGFALSNTSGCGEVNVEFTNNLPSNGMNGFSYQWDFGNSQTSSEENPSPITYSEPGVYEINYFAEIDTFGYQLTTVQVTAAGCSDFSIPPIFSPAPDLYLKLKDPDGNLIFETDPITNVSYPTVWNVNLFLGPGDYELEVRDDDSIGSDGCGKVTISQSSPDTLTDNELEVVTSVIHPVTEVTSTDTVTVLASPAPPIVSPDGLVEICEGEEVELVADYEENLQWFEDTTALLGEVGQMLIVGQSGEFWVAYSAPNGCQSQSETVSVISSPLPAIPAFHAEGNLLSINDPGLLPAEYTLQWFFNNEPVPGATDTVFCMTEPGAHLYGLQVTNPLTGCFSSFDIGLAFDPAYDCDMLLSSEETAAIEGSLSLFPNPVSDVLNIRFEMDTPMPFELSIISPVGKKLQSWILESTQGVFSKKMDVNALPAGIYFLQISMEDGAVVRRFVKK